MTALTQNAQRVLGARYLRRGPDGRVIESPEALFHRVARAVAEAELVLGTAQAADHWQRRFLDLLTSLDFLPNSPTLMNAGTALGQLSACFVLPIEDSMESIFDALRSMALIQRSGGGTGFSFSRLRPKGDVVATTGGEASGPVSFMRIFDCATENIRQGGRRRGANMGVLRVDHPDIREFVDAKLSGLAFANFNLSVGVTDRFMDAVVADASHELRHPGTGQVTRRLPARELFDHIVDATWRSGDPGLLFLDAVNRANPTPDLGAIESTNPCGEVPLLPYESCVLGSVNLGNMIRSVGDAADVDWDRLREAVRVGVRFLDDVIEVSREPLPAIAQMTRGNRKIGLGVMGFADALLRLGVSYSAEDATEWAERFARVIAEEARQTSRGLAAERGVFPNWPRSIYAKTGDRVRNATCLSVAPAGTISIIAGTSGGIEPLFALAYRRAHTLGGGSLVEVNPIFLRYAATLGLDAARLTQGILTEGRLGELAGIPEAARRLFVTALEVPPRQHLRIQAAFQRYVDNAVSKTINLPADSSAEDVRDAYMLAWRLGLKGITVYRYGSRSEAVLSLGAEQEPLARELFTKCDPGACRL